MNNYELNLIRDRLNSAISKGKGIDNKLHLMDDVESLITTIQEQQREIQKLGKRKEEILVESGKRWSKLIKIQQILEDGTP